MAAVLDAWEAKLAAFRRATWLPAVQAGDGPPTASKYAGVPWLRPGEPWPRCAVCRVPLLPVLQLDLRALPPRGEGLLQFFLCTKGDDYRAFSRHQTLRIVRPEGPGQANLAVPEDIPERASFPPKTITGWTTVADYPHRDEYDRLRVELTDDEDLLMEMLSCFGDLKAVKEDTERGRHILQVHAEDLKRLDLSVPDLDRVELLCGPRSGDKLGGWPYWTQGVEYPSCRRCRRPMELVYQIAANAGFTDYYSTAHMPMLFASDGTGHITQCPDHRDELTFSWTCG